MELHINPYKSHPIGTRGWNLKAICINRIPKWWIPSFVSFPGERYPPSDGLVSSSYRVASCRCGSSSTPGSGANGLEGNIVGDDPTYLSTWSDVSTCLFVSSALSHCSSPLRTSNGPSNRGLIRESLFRKPSCWYYVDFSMFCFAMFFNSPLLRINVSTYPPPWVFASPEIRCSHHKSSGDRADVVIFD